MLKALYLILALAATGIIVWQMGFLFSIPGAPPKPDYTITLSALTAAIIFFGLWYASVVHRDKSPERILT